MSFARLRDVLDNAPPTDPTMLLLLVVLANRADGPTGQCYPSVEGIAERMGVDRRTVQRTIARAVASGLLVIEARGGGRLRGTSGPKKKGRQTVYRLPAYSGMVPPLQDADTAAERRRKNGADTAAQMHGYSGTVPPEPISRSLSVEKREQPSVARENDAASFDDVSDDRDGDGATARIGGSVAKPYWTSSGQMGCGLKASLDPWRDADRLRWSIEEKLQTIDDPRSTTGVKRRAESDLERNRRTLAAVEKVLEEAGVP